MNELNERLAPEHKVRAGITASAQPPSERYTPTLRCVGFAKGAQQRVRIVGCTAEKPHLYVSGKRVKVRLTHSRLALTPCLDASP